MINWPRLAEPFPADDIHWRVGSASKKKPSATVLAYLDARNVMDRLDEVFGPAGWKDEYTKGPDGGVLCRLSAYVGDQWVSKEDGAENTAVEAIKGGYSGALKRAAVKWGIGRYLYALDAVWLPIKEGWPPDGVTTVSAKTPSGGWGYIVIPPLPKWALPRDGAVAPQEAFVPSPEVLPDADVPFDAEAVRRAKHHASWEDDRPGFCARLGAELDLDYNEVAAWSESTTYTDGSGVKRNNPRPSGMDPDSRRRLLDYLGTERGRAAFLDWKEERP